MEVDEIFDKFGVDAGAALVIDRSYIPNRVTVSDLISLSIRRKKPLNIVRRCKYAMVINEIGCMKKEYSELSKRSRRLLEEALEKADEKNAGYLGM